MKILFVCENYYPHLGGAEVLFKHLAEGFVKEGHQVSLITRRLKDTKKNELINGVNVFRVRSLNNRNLFTLFSIFKCIKLSKNVDIIQTTTFNGALPAWIASKIWKKPSLITILEVWVNRWQEVTDFNWINCKLFNFLEKMIYKLKFDRYICISNSTKKNLISIGINKEKIRTIYPGFNYKFWKRERFDPTKIRETLNLKDQFIYFSWGRPGPSKGFEYLIRAVPKISETIKDSVLLLMLSGKDKYKENYKKLIRLIKDIGVKDSIIIVPQSSYEELGNYIITANCIVIPSIAEGFGYTTLESCTLGTPVVASKTGSIPEVIGNKHILVKPRNSQSIKEGVVSIYSRKYQKTPLKKFSWEESINNYLKEYNNLIKK